jgi:hypothetical protein
LEFCFLVNGHKLLNLYGESCPKFEQVSKKVPTPRTSADSKAEVSKWRYSSKAKGFNILDLLSTKNTVHINRNRHSRRSFKSFTNHRLKRCEVRGPWPRRAAAAAAARRAPRGGGRRSSSMAPCQSACAPPRPARPAQRNILGAEQSTAIILAWRRSALVIPRRGRGQLGGGSTLC